MGLFTATVLMIVIWGLFTFEMISLDTVLIACMIWCLGLIIYDKR